MTHSFHKRDLSTGEHVLVQATDFQNIVINQILTNWKTEGSYIKVKSGRQTGVSTALLYAVANIAKTEGVIVEFLAIRRSAIENKLSLLKTILTGSDIAHKTIGAATSPIVKVDGGGVISFRSAKSNLLDRAKHRQLSNEVRDVSSVVVVVDDADFLTERDRVEVSDFVTTYSTLFPISRVDVTTTEKQEELFVRVE